MRVTGDVSDKSTISGPAAPCTNLYVSDPISSVFNISSDNNETGNGSAATIAPETDKDFGVGEAATVVACTVIILGTVLGNCLICGAVAITRRLRTPSNLLIVSLAISDILVGALDMPFAVLYEVTGRWNIGEVMCDFWTSIDVLFCTASILNICAISVDRYLVITRPFDYAMNRTPIRMFLMIGLVWILSAVISIPPLMGWKQEQQPNQCMVSQEKGYQFFATFGAFYVPLVIMVVIYSRIYMVSSRMNVSNPRLSGGPSTPSIRPGSGPGLGLSLNGRTNNGNGHLSATTTPTGEPPHTLFHLLPPPSPDGRTTNATTAADILNGESEQPRGRNGHLAPLAAGSMTLVTQLTSLTSLKRSRTNSGSLADAILRFNSRLKGRRGSRGHERKATRTLGVIMGAFVACWLPFFILALIRPFCHDTMTCIPQWVNSLFLWLGYTNSLLNPVIYARFNREFRTPFKYILQCRCANINSHLRCEEFTEQFGRAQTPGHQSSLYPPLLPTTPTSTPATALPPPPLFLPLSPLPLVAVPAVSLTSSSRRGILPLPIHSVPSPASQSDSVTSSRLMTSPPEAETNDSSEATQPEVRIREVGASSSSFEEDDEEDRGAVVGSSSKPGLPPVPRSSAEARPSSDDPDCLQFEIRNLLEGKRTGSSDSSCS